MWQAVYGGNYLPSSGQVPSVPLPPRSLSLSSASSHPKLALLPRTPTPAAIPPPEGSSPDE